MRTKIWTLLYCPFARDGIKYKPIHCEVDAVELVDIGKGKKAYLVIAPNGKNYIVENETGAIVGSSIEEVRNDIISATEKTISDQIKRAKKTISKGKKVSTDEFWKMLQCL